MREGRRALVIVVACAFVPRLAFAGGEPEDSQVPCCGGRIDGYRNHTMQTLAHCSRAVRVQYRESISIVDADKLRGCITTGMRDSRSELETALHSVRRKLAREALRGYQASFENALTGIEPTHEEAAAAYDQRQISLRHLLAHAWTRYELEER